MRPAAFAALVVAVLALTGCAGTTTGSVGVGTDKVGPAATDAPLTAESPVSAPASDAVFLEEVRANLPAKTQIPNATDAQLLDAGQRACERLAAGEASDQISVVEGEQQQNGYYYDSAVIITAARATLCVG